MSKKIIASNIPVDSAIKNQFDRIDFADAFAFYTQNNTMSLKEMYIAFFSTSPKWVMLLMKLRNQIVSLFGLKTGTGKNTTQNFEIGDKVGIFKIFSIDNHEIIAGENDKHLDFRVSIFREIDKQSKITVSTIVKYNNKFGKFYMTLISPFHKMVVRSILRNSIKLIDKYNDF